MIDAEEVHIGYSDESLEEARKELGADKIIGFVGSLEEAEKAEKGGADYLGNKTVLYRKRKDINEPLGLEKLEKIAKSVKIPTVAIGGYIYRYRNVMKTGVDGVAVISEILGKEDIKNKAAETLSSFIK